MPASVLPASVLPAPVLPDPETARAARIFVRHLVGRYPVKDVVLFGSRARGMHDDDGDAAFGRALNRVHEIRMLADDTSEPPGSDEAAWAVAQAEALLAEVQSKIGS